ncbi:hypothetical protein JVU11DRAFT_7823 [Chiua virens]|nr:hypothetical protein JVU11DRAFT_7823 [Chiua virens]
MDQVRGDQINDGRASPTKTDMDSLGKEQVQVVDDADGVDLMTYYEEAAGRLVVDPQQAKVEFGEDVASRLKLSEDGTIVLWPQPTNDPNDPQNWSNGRKALHLLIATMAAFVPDFDSAIGGSSLHDRVDALTDGYGTCDVGIAAIFPLAEQYDTTTGVINNLTSNWSIFLLGWGGIFYVMLMRRYGRLPVLFWSQLLSLGFLIGATFAPNLATFAGMRCLTAFFGLSERVLRSPYAFSSTVLFEFRCDPVSLIEIGSVYRHGYISVPPPRAETERLDVRLHYFAVHFSIPIRIPGCAGKLEVELWHWLYVQRHRPDTYRFLHGRNNTLVGMTGLELAKYRASWGKVIMACLNVVWRPQFLLVAIFEGAMFGFSIGMNVTNVLFLGTPPPVGFGFNEDIVSAAYATPMIAVVLGEILGRFANDWIMRVNIRRHGGFHEAESRLWICYVAVPLFLCGCLLLGAGIQHVNTASLIMGWGIAEVAVMINTVAIYAYCNDCFPKYQGEISALINLARVLGGFGVAFFQVPWATKSGGLLVFGVEAAYVPDSSSCLSDEHVVQDHHRSVLDLGPLDPTKRRLLPKTVPLVMCMFAKNWSSRTSNNAVARQSLLSPVPPAYCLAADMTDDTHAVSPVVRAVKDITFGSITGMVTNVFEHPFELTKVRLQSQVLQDSKDQ